MRTQGGFNKPRVNHTGKRYRGFVVIGLGPRHRDLLTWACRCKACGSTFSIITGHMAKKIRAGEGCGCRAGLRLKAPLCTCGGRRAA